ncbi:LuxR family transcriptional regulator [Rhodobacteraceae bacterium CCMM004]|nr:LuxR family transcriptional regulator [Rhodobacteraceae bacterium CCMM004]
MTTTEPTSRRGGRRLSLLWTLLAVQSFCAVFFALDAVLDFLGLQAETGLRNLDAFEYFVAAALMVGVVFIAREIARLTRRHRRMADQIAVASGRFADLIETHFEAWGLTPAESDVALLAIKGLSVAEIAAARGSAEGTVKAQAAAVYRKAGVSGRLQLLSLFIEELLAEPVLDGDRR